MLALLAAAAFSAAANAQPGSLPAPGTYAITNGMKHNGSWGLTIGNGHGGDQSLVSKANATSSFKLGPGLHNTTGTVSFESMAKPGHYLIQTGYEAWVVLMDKATVMKNGSDPAAAEFLLHTDKALPGWFAVEATGREKGKFWTARKDQGGEVGGYPVRIEGIGDTCATATGCDSFKFGPAGGTPPGPAPAPSPTPPAPTPPAPTPPAPPPPPPPGPAVTCDPKANPPEQCPGGKPCPNCGKAACTCPKLAMDMDEGALRRACRSGGADVRR